MIKRLRIAAPFSILLTILILVACDWDSGSDFNSSGGFSTNISGFYRGVNDNGVTQAGQRAVDRTSNGNILHLTIQQSGNRVDVVDSQGSKYVGSVGSPLNFRDSITQQIPAGATISSYQVSFAGKDEVANREVEFTGTVSFTAVSSINATVEYAVREGSLVGVGPTTEDAISNPAPNDTPIQFIDPVSGELITVDEARINVQGAGRIASVTYALSEQNTQFRLRGTWIEQGGVVSAVDAVSAGAAGAIEYVAVQPVVRDSTGSGGTLTTGTTTVVTEIPGTVVLPTPIPPVTIVPTPTPLPTPSP